jgi:hypothetical protein
MPFHSASWRIAVVIATGALAGLAGHLVQAASASKVELRGLNWDSIKHLPDWSGMWAPGRPPPGQSIPGFGTGGRGFGSDVPLAPKYAAIRDARMLRVRGEGAGGTEDIPLSNSGLCLPNGTPANMGPVAHEYLYSPGRVTILLENSEIRRIWTDGRGHVPDDESNPSFSGDSIGHWDGDTLVVETTNIYPEAELFIGQHVTEKTVVRERISRAGNRLRIDTVVEDPELFTKPWIYTRWYDHEDRAAVDYESCTAGDRAEKSDGRLIGIDFNVDRKQPGEKK